MIGTFESLPNGFFSILQIVFEETLFALKTDHKAYSKKKRKKKAQRINKYFGLIIVINAAINLI